MARTKVEKPDGIATEQPVISEDSEPTVASNGTAPELDPEGIEDVFKELKILLNAVEKLQRARQEVGDLKPLILRILDGELVSGEELDQLKSGIGGFTRLIRYYSDYQAALEKAQPAREFLDLVIK